MDFLLPCVLQALREWYEKEGPAMTKLLEQRVGQKGDPIPGDRLPTVGRLVVPLQSASALTFPTT